MQDLSSTLDAYLSNRFGITLERAIGEERAIGDAAAGVASLALCGSVDIVCDPVGRFVYDDEGISDQYQGLLTVEGMTYRFHCTTLTDASGATYVETIGDPKVVRL